MKTTTGIYRLSLQSKVVLAFTSVIALAGFVWPFFYVGNLHWIFVVAIAASAFLLISEVEFGPRHPREVVREVKRENACDEYDTKTGPGQGTQSATRPSCFLFCWPSRHNRHWCHGGRADNFR